MHAVAGSGQQARVQAWHSTVLYLPSPKSYSPELSMVHFWPLEVQCKQILPMLAKPGVFPNISVAVNCDRLKCNYVGGFLKLCIETVGVL